MPTTSSTPPFRLRTGYLPDPVGIDEPAPDLSWEIPADCAQSAYQVRAATSPELLLQGVSDLWDSGRVESAESVGVGYGGVRVGSRQRAYWQVRVWTGPGGPSGWSEPSRWEAGLLSPDDWSARWIGHPEWEASPEAAALPVFTEEFTVHEPVRSARLYVTALGVYDATINGQPVSDALLEPPDTDHTRRIAYAAYDVSAIVTTGINDIAVEVGTGTARIAPTPGRYQKLTRDDGPPRLFAQLEIVSSSGSMTTVATDSSWNAALGATTFSGWYGGEDHDARRTTTDWAQAVVTPPPASGVLLAARAAPPVRVVETIRSKAITEPSPGVFVVDLGVNFAGRQQLTVSGPRGTAVTMRPGELLATDGTVHQDLDGTGTPIWDTYTLSGEGTEHWHPRFRYHGMRYLQLEGLPEAPGVDTVRGQVMRAGNTPAGTFSCSNPLLTELHTIIDRAIQSNMYSILTDCPHREKLGWLEQTHLVFGPVSYGYDVAAYYRELVCTMAEAQTADGLVPDIAPEYTVFEGGFRDDPNWGGAIVLTPWEMYRAYGDLRTLHTYYPNMLRYVDYLAARSEGDLLNHGLGDWAEVEGTGTPVGVAATYGYRRIAETLAKIATVLGERTDAERFAALAERIGEAFNKAYFDTAAHTYAGGSQAADALALDLGVVPPEEYQAVLDHLVDGIRSAQGHLTVGEIALPALFRVLASAGRHDVLWDLVVRPAYPGYGYFLAAGSTSLPEYWDGPDGHGSQNHFMLGVIDQWLTGSLAGIGQAGGSVAHRDLVVRPCPVGDLTEVTAEHHTVRGPVRSHWKRDGAALSLEVAVPGNTTATVHVPLLGTDPAHVEAPGTAEELGIEHDYAVYRVNSGIWSFRITG